MASRAGSSVASASMAISYFIISASAFTIGSLPTSRHLSMLNVACGHSSAVMTFSMCCQDQKLRIISASAAAMACCLSWALLSHYTISCRRVTVLGLALELHPCAT